MHRSCAVLAVILLGGACGGGGGSSPVSPSSPATQTTTLRQNLTYTSGPPALRLDLHLPATTTAAPVIVYLHGADGTKEGGGLSDLVFRQRTRGYAVASLEYGSPNDGFPVPVHDGKAAVRWLRANAATYNLNPGRIAVWGTSWGAYIGAHLGVTDGVSALENLTQGSPTQSSRVQAVVAWSGFYDLVGVGPEDWLFVMLGGCQPAACPDRAAAASPVMYVDGGDSPFLLMHGRADFVVPWHRSQQMHDRLTAAGVPSTLFVLDGLGHGGAGWSSSAVMGPTESFLDTHLK